VANPLDDITTTRDDEGRPLRRVYITGNEDAPVGDPMGGGISMPSNKLEQAVAPEAPTDIMALIGKVREYLTGGVDPMQRLGDVMTTAPTLMLGPREPGTERQQLWPEKMVRSGATLPGEVAQGRVNMWEDGHTSPEVIERAQDTAGLAFPGALAQRPGTATLGSGPVRPAMRDSYTLPGYEIRPTNKKGFDVVDKDGNAIYTGRTRQDAQFLTAGNPGSRIRPSAEPLVQVVDTKNGQVIFDPTSRAHAEAWVNVDPNKVSYVRGQGSMSDTWFPWNKDTGMMIHIPGYQVRKSGSKWGVFREGEAAPVSEHNTKSQAEKAVNANVHPDLDRVAPTLMSDSGTPGSGVAAVANSTKGPAPVFYSALEHVVTNAAQDTMSPQQWAGYLKNQPGVKAEELAWTGVGDWLAGQKGKVSKKDVQQYLDEHKVEIKDVTKGGPGRMSEGAINDAVTDSLNEWRLNFKDDNGRYPRPDEIEAARLDFHQDIMNSPERYSHLFDEGNTKYESYQLPGGENYREHLLTMPESNPIIKLNAEYKALSDEYLRSKGQGLTPEKQARWAQVEEEISKLRKEGVTEDTGRYRSSHWDEPNVLAHVRTNERDVGGKPSLHIEEIQSDWHQQGRKVGYRDHNTKKQYEALTQELKEAKLAVKREENRVQTEAIGTTLGRFEREHPNHQDRNQAARKINDHTAQDKAYQDAVSLVSDLNSKLAKVRPETGVPDAPFKTSWPELALKRMIRLAAEEGKDRISWTPGEAQAARYDLSKQVEHINVKPPIGKSDRHVAVNARSGVHASALVDEKGIVTQGYDAFRGSEGKNLADLVGKDMAEKILKADKEIKFEGEGLKVGGEGMREFYDKMLPKMVEKLGKAHGVKVQKSKTPGMRDMIGNYIPEDKVTNPYHDVLYFDIPPAWKDQAIGKGFPLYMSGIPFPLTPVDYDPFKQEK